jgi:dephospho-CoA kinase|tara:strand:- start:4411 stop:4998 length:588 start_codon:yes stop_codon:yes gene_type:complete
MKVIGITGGIASGKSILSSYLKDRYKAYIFNADEEAKKLLNDDIVKDKIKETFPNISDLSLKSIADEAFQNKESQKKLNNIIHPIINQVILERIKEKKNSYNLFIIDAALIIESGMFEYHKSNESKLVLVVADEEIRIQRALARNNLSKKTIIDRIKLQMEDSQKIKHADFVIYNNSSTSELFNEIDKIIKNINE